MAAGLPAAWHSQVANLQAHTPRWHTLARGLGSSLPYLAAMARFVLVVHVQTLAMLLVGSFGSHAASPANKSRPPTKLIIDTDIGGGGCRDLDDVCAVCIANVLHDRGEAELLAVVVNTTPLHCPGVVSAINHYFGHDDVPIGSFKDASSTPGGMPGLGIPSDRLPYVDAVATRWAAPVHNATQVPDAIEVYRRVLASQPDHSVTISSIGLSSNLKGLLTSEADEHSPLNGHDLVAKKVKMLAVMGGRYTEPMAVECNLAGGGGDDHKTGAADSAYVYSHWPPTVRLLFDGFNMGAAVHTGAPLGDCTPIGNPCRQAFLDTVGYGGTRDSFDPLTTLIAVRGLEAVGMSESTIDGTNFVNGTTGANHWVPGPKSNQSYVLPGPKSTWATDARDMMDALLCQPPKQPPGDGAERPQPYPITSTWGKFSELAMSGATAAAGGSHDRSAFDDDIYTYYQYAGGPDGAWTAVELRDEEEVVFIEFYARADSREFLNRTIGGRFVGVAADGTRFELATINRTRYPVEYGNWNGLLVAGDGLRQKARWVRYEGPTGSYGNIAEIKLYGRIPQPKPTPPVGVCEVGTGALSGAGPPSTYGHGGGNYTLAWDDNVFTFYDYYASNGGWTQAALATPAAIRHIEYYPRDGYLSRSTGGRFVGIGSDGGEVTLATIPSTPTLAWQGLAVNTAGRRADTKFVAVKYVGADGSNGNVAEVKVFAAC